MRYAIQQLCGDVLNSLGEIERPQDETCPSGVPWPEDIIAIRAVSLLPEAGGRLIREAPAEAGGYGASGLHTLPTEMRLMPCGLYAAEVRLPDDFIRLGSVKMSGWQRSVCSVVAPGMSGWSRQWSSQPGIAGCPVAPRAYLDGDADGMILRLIGSECEDEEMEWFTGWAVPQPDPQGFFHFPTSLYPMLVSTIANLLND